MELQEGIDEFIEKFKRVRKERGHSQEDVSRQILIAKDHLNRIMNRRRNPGLQSLYRMMQYVYPAYFTRSQCCICKEAKRRCIRILQVPADTADAVLRTRP